MADEGFLRRWARRKAESQHEEEAAPEPVPVAEVAAVEDASPPPTLDDVAQLTPESDFSAFVARGVDAAVRQGALKKLFADPHFAAMDGLDIYIGDYTQASPVPPAMLAALSHARRVLHVVADAALPGDTTIKPDQETEHEHPPDPGTERTS